MFSIKYPNSSQSEVNDFFFCQQPCCCYSWVLEKDHGPCGKERVARVALWPSLPLHSIVSVTYTFVWVQDSYSYIRFVESGRGKAD